MRRLLTALACSLLLCAHATFVCGPAAALVWRGLIGPHFANPPHVEHFTDVQDS